jgi:hypothetical protein
VGSNPQLRRWRGPLPTIKKALAAGVKVVSYAGFPGAVPGNEFACLWHQYKDSQPTYRVATESSRNSMVNIVLCNGLAAVNGIINNEPSTYNLLINEVGASARRPSVLRSARRPAEELFT